MLNKVLIAIAMVAVPTVSIAADMPYIVEAPATFDDRWSGSFIGIQAGYSNLTAKEAGVLNKTVSGPAIGLFGGHNFVFDNVLIGAELSAELTDDNTILTTRTSGETNWSAGAALRWGYVMGAYVPYLKAGIGLTEMEATFIPTGQKDTAVHTNLDFGGGFETMVADDVSLRIEGIYRITSKEDYTINGATGGVEADGFIGRIGLACHF